jgi:hypothetical protein
LLDIFLLVLGDGGDERPLALILGPPATHLVESVTVLGLTAIDHHVAEQVEVARALPDLRVHDDRRVEADHFVSRRCARRLHELVVARDHIAPPGFFDIPLQLDAERAVVPKPVEPAVNLARLKQKPPAATKGDEFVHVHGETLT